MNTRPVLIDQYGNPLAVDITGISDGDVLTYDSTTGLWVPAAAGGSGAPTTADYLVGTANAGLSAEIVVGTTPGGELGGTWGSPTVDATHSGSAHHTRLHTVTDTNDHTFPGGTTTFLRADGTFASVGGGGSGGEWDTEIRKSANEDVVSSTTVQADDHLTTTPTSGVPFVFDILVAYSNAAGTGPEIKIAVGEDTTVRGGYVVTGLGTTDAVVHTAQNARTSETLNFGTDTAQRSLWIQGTYTGAGGAFALHWAQAVSNATATRVHAGSVLRLRYLD